MGRAYIFLAEGFEDTEALGTLDVLRRGGVDASLVSITEDPFVVSSHGVAVGVDTNLSDIEVDVDDVMVFPGGMPGSKNLAACKPLVKLMNKHFEEGGSVAAICASPGLILCQLPSLEGYEMTCFDGFEGNIQAKGGKFTPKPAVTCGQIITGRSAGYSLQFGLEIVRRIYDDGVTEKVKSGLFLDCE